MTGFQILELNKNALQQQHVKQIGRDAQLVYIVQVKNTAETFVSASNKMLN